MTIFRGFLWVVLVKIPRRPFHQLPRQRFVVGVFAAQVVGENLVEAVELADFDAAHEGTVAPGFSFGNELESVGEQLAQAEVAEFEGLFRADVVENQREHRIAGIVFRNEFFQTCLDFCNGKFVAAVHFPFKPGARRDGLEGDGEVGVVTFTKLIKFRKRVRFRKRQLEKPFFRADFRVAQALGAAGIPGVGVQVYFLKIVPMTERDVLKISEFGFIFRRKHLLAVLFHEEFFAQRGVQHQDVELARDGFEALQFLVQNPIVVDVRNAVYDRAVELEFFPSLAKNRIDAVEVAQRPQDGAVVNRLRRLVVAGNDEDGDFGVAKPFELFEAEGECPVGGAWAVEKIAAVDDYVRFFGQNPRHHALESVVHILFAGVDAFGVHAVEGLKAEVGVGEMEERH